MAEADADGEEETTEATGMELDLRAALVGVMGLLGWLEVWGS